MNVRINHFLPSLLFLMMSNAQAPVAEASLPVISEEMNLFCITNAERLTESASNYSDYFNVQFSHPAGFYDSPFQVTLSSPDSRFMVQYTIDGSNPVTSSTAKRFSSPVSIMVDPTDTQGRAATPGFIIRACLWYNGVTLSNSITRTYLFAEQVKTQVWPGGEWPSKDINGQRLDYEMASDVVNHPDYNTLILPALKQIPSISLVTDLSNLFNPATGIYVNATKKGEDWERDCSIELINPNGNEGFQANAGMRIRGGNSAKKPENPKRGFRLFFRQKYGTAKLEFPLFGNQGAASFDCLDLRCEQNYSWNMDGNLPNSMVKDIFSRDIQRAMGQPNEQGDYCHLYLNGMYWGLYQTDERPEASYAATYLGGDKDDYDVIKVNTQPWPYYNEATDGSMDSWEYLWTLCQRGFSTNKNYFFLEGKDENGKPVKKSEVLVDIDNLIDYMLLIFYTGNFDAPVSAWYGDDMPNNFFAIFNRNNITQGYKFVAHDSEHCMFVQNLFGRKGINENRVNIGTNGSMRILRALEFNPQWLHYKLTSNAEYRLRFADRAARYLTEEGILTPEKTAAQFQKRANEIDIAVIAESARWGDAKSPFSLTRNEHWLPEIQSMRDKYFPFRTAIVISQLKNEKLFSALSIPHVFIEGNEIRERKVYFDKTSIVTVKNPGSNGVLYYTLDGSDPRSVGGAVAPTAIVSQSIGEISITETTHLIARIKNGSEWGPKADVLLSLENETYQTLKVTELHYHPADTIIGADTLTDEMLEFIEFKNTGNTLLDLSGMHFTSGISYRFPENSLLAPDKFYVIASKPNLFYLRYSIYPSGNYSQQLSNGGEQLTLANREAEVILTFTYSDKEPWPTEADGLGYTLSAVDNNPKGDPNLPAYWRKSSQPGGSPFANDKDTLNANPELLSEIFSVRIFPNPATQYLTIALNEPNDVACVVIFTADGKRIASFSFDSQTEINLAEYGIIKGVYLIQIESNNGKYMRRLVVTGK